MAPDKDRAARRRRLRRVLRIGCFLLMLAAVGLLVQGPREFPSLLMSPETRMWVAIAMVTIGSLGAPLITIFLPLLPSPGEVDSSSLELF